MAITGAASGIGAALARSYARRGARIGLLDRDLAGAEQLAAALRAGGASARALPCDVTSAADCEAAIGELCRLHEGLDVLVANAGITHLSPFRDTEVEVLRRVMEVNFFGAVHCTRAALEALLASRGQIVVLSSVAGFAPLAKRTGYAASKFALHGFFETLRSEHRDDGLGVLLVCPWFVDTRIGASALGGNGRPAADPRRDAGRPQAPDVVAEAIVRAALRDRRLLVVSPPAKLAWAVSRFAPRLYERLMLRRVRSA